MRACFNASRLRCHCRSSETASLFQKRARVFSRCMGLFEGARLASRGLPARARVPRKAWRYGFTSPFTRSPTHNKSLILKREGLFSEKRGSLFREREALFSIARKRGGLLFRRKRGLLFRIAVKVSEWPRNGQGTPRSLPSRHAARSSRDPRSPPCTLQGTRSCPQSAAAAESARK